MLKHKKLLSLACCIICFLLLIICVHAFITGINNTSNVVSQSVMDNYATQCKNIAATILYETQENLLALATNINSFEGEHARENIFKKMQQQMYVGVFSFLAYGDMDGTIENHQNQKFVLDDPSMMIKLSAGEIAVSGKRKSFNADYPCIAIAVPIYKDGIPQSFLYTELDLKLIQSTLKTTDTAKENLKLELIQKNGNYLFNMENNPSTNFFTAIQDFKFSNDVTVQKLSNYIKDGASGQCVITSAQNISYTLDYRPLDINGWYILTSIPSDDLHVRRDYINYRGIVLGVEAGFVCFLAIGMAYTVFTFLSRRLERKQSDVDAIIENLNGGVFEYSLDEKAQFSYISDNFCTLLGYTPEAFREKFDNCFLNMVFVEDREKIQEFLRECSKNELPNIAMEYRVETIDKDIIWLYDKIKIHHEHDKTLCMSVSTVITDIKNMHEEIVANESCFNLIMERTNSIILRWDIIQDSVEVSEVWNKKFGYQLPEKGLDSQDSMQDIIFEDDMKKFLKLCTAIANGKHYAEEILRINQLDVGYIWCRVCMTGMNFKGQKPCNAVAVVMDIDREKRQMAKMKIMAERDGLSTLYNKTATSKIVNEFLLGEGRTYNHALLMFDIDHFKDVNDTFGHIYGDAAIVEFANILKTAFRSSDIIGRVGGDEFVVFVKHITHIDQVIEKAEEINRLARNIHVGQNNSHVLSTSIGISTFPEDGLNYGHLYRTADVALYSSKKKGRDCYTVYEFGMQKDD